MRKENKKMLSPLLLFLTHLYQKVDFWLKYFGHSNLLCTRATRAIINYAPIGKYYLRFFS